MGRLSYILLSATVAPPEFLIAQPSHTRPEKNLLLVIGAIRGQNVRSREVTTSGRTGCQRFQHARIKIEISQIMIHQADRPEGTHTRCSTPAPAYLGKLAITRAASSTISVHDRRRPV